MIVMIGEIHARMTWPYPSVSMSVSRLLLLPGCEFVDAVGWTRLVGLNPRPIPRVISPGEISPVLLGVGLDRELRSSAG